jgi:hypothetical protein
LIRLLADENFNGKILRGLRQRLPALDLVRVQDVGLGSALDPMVLEWAAREERVLLTHDVRTMPDHAYERVGRGMRMAGMVVIDSAAPVGPAIEEIALLLVCSLDGELEDQVRYLSLR